MVSACPAACQHQALFLPRFDTHPWSKHVYLAESAQRYAVGVKERSFLPYRMVCDRWGDTVMGRLQQGWVLEKSGR